MKKLIKLSIFSSILCLVSVFDIKNTYAFTVQFGCGIFNINIDKETYTQNDNIKIQTSVTPISGCNNPIPEIYYKIISDSEMNVSAMDYYFSFNNNYQSLKIGNTVIQSPNKSDSYNISVASFNSISSGSVLSYNLFSVTEVPPSAQYLKIDTYTPCSPPSSIFSSPLYNQAAQINSKFYKFSGFDYRANIRYSSILADQVELKEKISGNQYVRVDNSQNTFVTSRSLYLTTLNDFQPGETRTFVFVTKNSYGYSTSTEHTVTMPVCSHTPATGLDYSLNTVTIDGCTRTTSIRVFWNSMPGVSEYRLRHYTLEDPIYSGNSTSFTEIIDDGYTYPYYVETVYTDGTSLDSNFIVVPVPITCLTSVGPVISLTANPTAVYTGESSTLVWNIEPDEGMVCTSTGFNNDGGTQGQQVVANITENRDFVFSCTDAGGVVYTASTTVSVLLSPPPVVLDTTTPPSPCLNNNTAQSTFTLSSSGVVPSLYRYQITSGKPSDTGAHDVPLGSPTTVNISWTSVGQKNITFWAVNSEGVQSNPTDVSVTVDDSCDSPEDSQLQLRVNSQYGSFLSNAVGTAIAKVRKGVPFTLKPIGDSDEFNICNANGAPSYGWNGNMGNAQELTTLFSSGKQITQDVALNTYTLSCNTKGGDGNPSAQIQVQAIDPTLIER